MLNRKILAGAVLAGTTCLAGGAFAGTLEDVKERGMVRCGISEGVAGFSAPNDAGKWEGLDVDVCRAVAAAIFGDAEKVEYISLNSKDRFTALQSGEVDLLPRTTTHTLTRDTSLGIDFVGVNYYDGQGIMIRSDLGIDSVKELDGVTVCLRSGSTTERNLADYFASNGMEFSSVVFDKSDEIRKAYAAGRCDVMSGDRAQLAIRRSQLEDPDAHKVLDEVISKEPLAIAVRQGDDEWDNVVRWAFNTMLLAEEHGLTQANVAEMRDSTNSPEVKRLLGVDGEFGSYLGLPQDWGYQVIANVGNYGESFERNLGKDSPVGLSRGMNALWKDGGLQYSPPAN
jgi:general L-amino acid transport system substrate-binding protein